MAEVKEEAPVMQEMTPDQINQFMSGGDINKIAQQEAPKEEEKPEEHKPVDTPDAPTVENESGAAPDTPPEVPQEFNIEFFNKQFSTEFTDEDSIKEALKSVQEIEGLKKQVDTISTLNEELEILRKELSEPNELFSEDDYRVAQFRKTFPDKDPAVVAKLFSADLSNVNDFDFLTWMTMLDNPNLDGGEKGARELVADLYGIDDAGDLSELDTLTKNKLRRDAGKDRTRLSEMKTGLPVPEKKDYSTIVEQRKAEQVEKLEKLNADWNTLASAVIKEYPDFVINDTDKDGNVTELFRYKVGGDISAETVKPIVDGFIRAGVPVDKASGQALGVALQKDFLYRNRDKIIQQAIKDATAKLEEKTLQEEHNPGKPNESERKTGTGPNVTDQILNDLRNGGLQPKRAY